MRACRFPLLIILLALILVFPIPGFGKNYVQYFASGKVDWSNGVVEAVGLSSPPANPLNPAQSRSITKSEAEGQARLHLFEIVKEIRIDSKSAVRDVAAQADFPFADLQSILRRAEVVDTAYLDNGAVKIAVSMSLAGSFADLVLPKNILMIDTIQQPDQPNKKEESFTGLVVDCRGLPVKPALAPVILDEEGHVIFGSVHVSREHAVQAGVVSYAKDLAEALRNPRVGPKPLTIKGIRVAKARESDVVISNADGGKIKGDPSNLQFLRACRVIMVLD